MNRQTVSSDCNNSSQNGISTVLFLILFALLGIIAYLLISATFPFKDTIYSLFYPKPASFAGSPTPSPTAKPY